MSLPSYADANAQAADEPAFSNGFEWDHWSANWCGRCVNDADEGCPLVLVAMMGKTPAEWTPKDRSDLGEQYECTLFVADA
jgi:hypothetical protein